MPTYNVRNRKTGKRFTTDYMTIAEMEQWEKDNPDIEVLCGAPVLHSGIGLGLKSQRNTDDFKSKIKEIKKRNPGNTIDKYI